MRTFKHFLIGIMGVVVVCGTVVMLTPTANEAKGAKGSGTLFGQGFGKGKCDVLPTWKGPIRGKKRWVPTYFDKNGKPHAYCDRQTGIVLQAIPGEPPGPNCGIRGTQYQIRPNLPSIGIYERNQ